MLPVCLFGLLLRHELGGQSFRRENMGYTKIKYTLDIAYNHVD